MNRQVTSDELAILGAALAAVIAVVAVEGTFDIWDAVSGLTILLFLFSYGHLSQTSSSGILRLAVSSVCAVIIILIIGVAVDRTYFWKLYASPPLPTDEGRALADLREGTFGAIWVILTAFYFVRLKLKKEPAVTQVQQSIEHEVASSNSTSTK